MQELDIKRGHGKNVNLADILDEHFGAHTTRDGPEGTWYEASGPALRSFRLLKKDNAKMLLEIEEDRSATSEQAMEAIKLKNRVLEAATGFTAKQRAQRAQQAAKKAE
jgi:hypothetical protein